MEENTDELNDIAAKINGHVVAISTALNDAWRSELITLNLPGEVLNRLWLETAYFGVYLLQKKFSAPLGEEKKKIVNKSIRDAFLLIMPTVFGDRDDDNSDLKNYIASQYDLTLEMYENYKGVDVRLLFRDLVRDVFNSTEGSKIKFIENTFGNRLKLKIAFILVALGGDKKWIDEHSNEVYLPNENLIAFANSAAQAFANINESEIRE